MMGRIAAAVRQGRAGRAALTALWDEIGAGGDPLHRCSLAHHLADLQDEPEAELVWDERALAAVAELTDERARRYHAALRVRAFLPSLHLNLADVHHRLDHPEQAREHLAAARAAVHELPDDGYGQMIRGGMLNLAGKLVP
ncbi:hypothetical protein [Dactylosporangium sp. NPDC051541]|uniref:hypothetical protein n=1 Tax=Dactylosporangium sp. NPDC051541 TaxID=3363977 RepID=UPI00379ED1A7